MLGWTEVAVDVPSGWEELVAETLAIATGSGVAFGPASLAAEPAPSGCEHVRAFVSAERDTPRLRAEISNALARVAERTGASELHGLAPRFRELPPEDYARSWEKVWKPFRVGRLCVLRPKDERRPASGDVVLRLEPGAVFGTGRHATTRACLFELQRLVRPGERVLDAGTGTGILAVAAALLGAERALGFDVDPNAGSAFAELARANRVEQRCEFRAGGFEVLGDAERAFDGVLANIQADVLIEHAPALASRVKTGGWCLLSGIHRDHREAVLAALGAAGLAIEREDARGRWHTFACRRAPTRSRTVPGTVRK